MEYHAFLTWLRGGIALSLLLFVYTPSKYCTHTSPNSRKNLSSFISSRQIFIRSDGYMLEATNLVVEVLPAVIVSIQFSASKKDKRVLISMRNFGRAAVVFLPLITKAIAASTGFLSHTRPECEGGQASCNQRAGKLVGDTHDYKSSPKQSSSVDISVSLEGHGGFSTGSRQAAVRAADNEVNDHSKLTKGITPTSANNESFADSSLKNGRSLEVITNTTESEILQGRMRLKALSEFATNLTDKFAEKVASLAAHVDLVRMNVIRARDEVQRLNESFDQRTKETLEEIDERTRRYGSDLADLEKALDYKLNPDTGAVSKRIGELREELLRLRALAMETFEKETALLMQQVDSCSAKVDSLTEMYFSLKSRADTKIQEIEASMAVALRNLEDLVQEQLALLTETERAATARASQRFKDYLKSLQLEENVLQIVVRNIQHQFLGRQTADSRTTKQAGRGAAVIDLSRIFSNSKIEKVCAVIAHLVTKLLPGKIVVPIFIHTVRQKAHQTGALFEAALVDFDKQAYNRYSTNSLLRNALVRNGNFKMGRGRRRLRASKKNRTAERSKKREAFQASKAPVNNVIELALPSIALLKATAALWLQEQQAYALSYDHYAVIRIRGYLIDCFTIPFLKSLPYSYAEEKDFVAVRSDDFVYRLKTSLEEKLDELRMTLSLHEDTYLLIAYMGEVADGEGMQLLPTLSGTADRLNLARQLIQNIKPQSPTMQFFFKYFQHKLRFLNRAEHLLKQGLKDATAAYEVLQDDDIRVAVITENRKYGVGDTSDWNSRYSCCWDNDYFFKNAFATLRLRLKQLDHASVIFPSEPLLALAVDHLVWQLSGKGNTSKTLILLQRFLLSRKVSNIMGKGKDKGNLYLQWEAAEPTCGALITTEGHARRLLSPQVVKASLALFQPRTTEAYKFVELGSNIRKMSYDDDLTQMPLIEDKPEYAVLMPFDGTSASIAKLTLDAVVQVLRVKLDHVARAYTLYVFVSFA